MPSPTAALLAAAALLLAGCTGPAPAAGCAALRWDAALAPDGADFGRGLAFGYDLVNGGAGGLAVLKALPGATLRATVHDPATGAEVPNQDPPPTPAVDDRAVLPLGPGATLHGDTAAPGTWPVEPGKTYEVRLRYDTTGAFPGVVQEVCRVALEARATALAK